MLRKKFIISVSADGRMSEVILPLLEHGGIDVGILANKLLWRVRPDAGDVELVWGC